MNNPKIKAFLNFENFLLIFIGIIFAVNTFLFVYFKLHHFNILKSVGVGRIGLIYFFLALIFLVWLAYVIIKRKGALYMLKKILLTFLLTEAVLFYGYVFNEIGYDKSIFTYILRPFVGLYLIAVCFYFLFKHKNYKKIGDFFKDFGQKGEKKDKYKVSEEKKISSAKLGILGKIAFSFKKRATLAGMVLLFVIIINLGFGSYYLAQFAAVDEPLWSYDRIPKFWSNVADGEWWKTMVSDKPGITVAIISGAGMHWVSPEYYKNSRWEEKSLKNYLSIEDLNFTLRFPILLFNALMLLPFYFLLKKLLGKFIALSSVILIGLSPLLLGISRIVNPDSLLWVFMPLSLIAYLVYIKDRENKYLYWAGIFLGLAILTKYVANILYVFFFGSIFLEYMMRRIKYENAGVAEYFKKSFADYFILVFFSLLTFFIFLPAAWIDIGRVLEGTILSQAFYPIWPFFMAIVIFILFDTIFWKNRLMTQIMRLLSRFSRPLVMVVFSLFLLFFLGLAINTYGGIKFFDLESILASPKTSFTTNNFLGMMLANFYSLFFGISPIAFLAIGGLSLLYIFSKKKPDENYFWAFYLAAFIFLYYTASIFNNVSATIRYQIAVFPLAFILAGMGIYYFVQLKIIRRYLSRPIIYSVIILLSASSLWTIKPFYFSYASEILPKKYVLNLKDMGDGSYEAAQHLNTLPDAQNLFVWTDKNGVCSFFIGKCDSFYDTSTFMKTKIDYFVISSGRKTKFLGATSYRPDIPYDFKKLYDSKNSDFSIYFGNRAGNYIKVLSAEQFKK